MTKKYKVCTGCKCLVEQCTCLPVGATCEDCYAFSYCEGFMQRKAETTYCDYFPIRFHRPQREAQS